MLGDVRMSAPVPAEVSRPVTVPDFLAARSRGTKLAVLTCYEYTMARLLDAAGVDGLLVGDSLGMVVQGHEHCLKVTLDDVVYHTRCVARGTRRALVVADLPFMTYQEGPRQAVRNAGRLVQEGGAHAVKLEGGVRCARQIRAVTRADVPVMGHIGMTPQSVHRFGGFRVQRDEAGLLADARAVEDAGAFAVVLECVPADAARRVTEALSIPTIGIGAGEGCDGQVLVAHDALGLFPDFKPRFARRFADLGPAVTAAAAEYCRSVRDGSFPAAENTFR
jgi:3-methyl-2-oxobutanoate hydroxymethyltransferase